MTAFTIETNGARLYGVEQGYGDPVIFLHAGVADHRMWEPQMDAMRLDMQAVAYDQRGHGRTESEDVAYADLDDLQAVLDHFSIGRAVLVGCSMGGGLATAFALEHPERVAGLVLVAAAIPGMPFMELDAQENQIDAEYAAMEAGDNLEALNQFEARVWLDGVHGREGRVQGPLRDLFLEMNKQRLNHPLLNHKQARPECFSRLSEIQVPVLLIAGLCDSTYYHRLNDQLAETHGNMHSRHIDNAGHLPNLDDPESFNGLLSAYLATL